MIPRFSPIVAAWVRSFAPQFGHDPRIATNTIRYRQEGRRLQPFQAA
jgi:hypothetical protein